MNQETKHMFFWRVILSMGGLFLLDLILKQVMHAWRPKGSVQAFFTFDYYQNPHLSYGISLLSRTWIIVLACTLILLLGYELYRSLKRGQIGYSITYALIITGALNNLFDRLIYGFVIDYISVWPSAPWGRFPTFNLSDVYITIGIFWLIYAIIHKKPSQDTRS